MSKLDLWPESPTIQAGQVETGFTLEDASGERQRIWYRCSSEQQAALVESCDPYVLAALFIAMQKKTDLVVHGQASPSLLKNLCEFQYSWVSWRPDLYAPVEIRAELERESEQKPDRAVLAAFSGGVDSAFTAWRHYKKLAGRQNQLIQACLMVHGLDIRLNQPQVYERAAIKAQRMLESLGMELVMMTSNLKKTGTCYEHSHAALLASCMALLQGGFAAGIVASSYPYNDLLFPWGSNPLTDRMLSSAAFAIVHDGAAYNRLEKIQAISAWPEALQELRVCLHGEERDENCCRCEKCVRTILEFRTLGLGLPECFKKDASLFQVLTIRNHSSAYFYRSILKAARARQIRRPWVYALKWTYFHNNIMLKLRSSLRQPRWLKKRKSPQAPVGPTIC